MPPLPPTLQTQNSKKVVENASEPTGGMRRIWTVGTLRYTTGTLAILFCWLLLGDFAWSMRDRSVGPMAAWYLNHLKVPNLLYGILLSSFPALVGLILAPIISVKSDRYRSRWGRRIPFLLITTPIASFGMLGLALTPLVAKKIAPWFPSHSEAVVAIICFGIFWALFECATIAGQAVLGGLINDVVPQAVIGRFLALFRAVSLIDGMIFNFWIMGKVPTHFSLIMISAGLFYGVAFIWVCCNVREGEYPPPTACDTDGGKQRLCFRREVSTYFRECFSHPYYALIFVMMMTAGLAFSPVNVFSIPYAKSLGITEDGYGKSLALTYMISLSLSFVLGWMADRFHPLRMAMAMLVGYTLATFWGWQYVTSPQTFYVAWVLHGVLSGCYFTSAASLGQRLFLPEKYAQFASAAGMLAAIGNMGLAPLLGGLIDGNGSEYQIIFAVASALALAAVITTWIVYRKFLSFGGPDHYRPPLTGTESVAT